MSCTLLNLISAFKFSEKFQDSELQDALCLALYGEKKSQTSCQI